MIINKRNITLNSHFSTIMIINKRNITFSVSILLTVQQKSKSIKYKNFTEYTATNIQIVTHILSLKVVINISSFISSPSVQSITVTLSYRNSQQSVTVTQPLSATATLSQYQSAVSHRHSATLCQYQSAVSHRHSATLSQVTQCHPFISHLLFYDVFALLQIVIFHPILIHYYHYYLKKKRMN